jgi:hypothetical protein
MSVLASTCCLAGGCATTPLPRGFDPASVRLVAASSAPKFEVSGLPGGKPAGAGLGAGTGGGIGLVATAMACAAAGPLVGICLATVLPAVTAVGVVAGGVAGAVHAESTGSIAVKTRALADEFAATPYQERLARTFQQETGIAVSADSKTSDAKTWTLEVGIAEVEADAGNEFAVHLVAYAQLRHDGAAPEWTTRKSVQSETRLTTAEWLADDSQALRNVLERCGDQAARELAGEIARKPPDAAGYPIQRTADPASCHDAHAPPAVPTIFRAM